MCCEYCGFMQNDFKKYGCFGCLYCYEMFNSMIELMFDNMYKGMSYIGKVLQKVFDCKFFYDCFIQFEGNFDVVIKFECYEDVVCFCDEIN